MPAISGASAAFRFRSSRPRKLSVSFSRIYRVAMVPEASRIAGSTFVVIRNRTSRWPVQNAWFFRLMVCRSPPDIDSSSSAILCVSARELIRASVMVASFLSISGQRPNSPPRLLKVGKTQLVLTQQPHKHEHDGALAGAWRADDQKDLLLPCVGRQQVSGDFLQGLLGFRIVFAVLVPWPNLF